MGIDDLISGVLPDYIDLMNEALSFSGEAFVGGVLAAVIAWAIGYAIYTAFHWLSSWTNAS